MTKKELKKIIVKIEFLMQANELMVHRLYNDADLDVSDIIELLNANTLWLEFNHDCLKTGLKKVF